MRSVTLHDGPLRVGATATIDQPRIPTVRWTVTALTPGRSFTWESGGPGPAPWLTTSSSRRASEAAG
ncbi:MAG: hypothetical protein HOQ21_14525 [Dermatophilaceae bacterium]|nr:hypothetical protein [Dermatophilaceae bacterium]